MSINKFIILYKKLILHTILAVFYIFSSPSIYAQGFVDVLKTNTITSLAGSESKPQSKVWNYGSYWWAVIPIDENGGNPAGTYLWRLDGVSWTKILKLSDSTRVLADTKAIGNITHIILQHEYGFSPRYAILVSLQFVSGSPPTYDFWSSRPTPVIIDLDNYIEVATIDIDSQGRMWLASDANSDINVRWSDPPYTQWSTPITIGSCSNDDICAVTAFGGDKIGVLWSNQSDDQFQFSYHVDGTSTNTWSSEIAAEDGSNPIADDHINLAVSSDGTIYAAVKTSYTALNSTCIALLKRESTTPGIWNFYHVRNKENYPTRPIALLEDDNIFVVYQQSEGGGPIMYKYSNISSINFPSAETYLTPEIDDDDYQDVTSTKQNFTSEVAILFVVDGTDPDDWSGVLAGTEPLPVELALFDAIVLEDRIILKWSTETEVSNYGFDIERLVENSGWVKLGFVEGHGNSNSPKEYSFADYDITRAGRYKYRLKQIDNDGKFEYSYVITVYVGAPAAFYLSQNYPNPFNPSTQIDYSVPQASKVSLKVFDILGREVASLVDEYKEIGTYTVTFDASNLPGGIYFYTISAGNFVESKKMSLVK
jgi:hypothetical protein